MTSIDELAPPSNSLKAEDLEGGELSVTITGYEVREFDQTDQQSGETYKQRKPILSFKQIEKTLVCNKTNREEIASVYSREMDNWIGKVIVLYPTVVPFGNKQVPAIRVRVPRKPSAQSKLYKPAQSESPAAGLSETLDDEIPF